MPPPYKLPQSVLVVMYTPEARVLLLRRADTGAVDFWQSVTGSKDALQESFAQTAVREVWEETGVDCGAQSGLAHCLHDWGVENVYAIYPQWRHRYAPGVTHNTERLFGLALPQELPIRLSPREHTHYRWLPYQEAAQRCYSPSNAEAILQLSQRMAARS